VVVSADIFSWLQSWAPILGQLGLFMAGIIALAGGGTIIVRYERERDDTLRFKREQIRISYRNLNITHDFMKTHTANAPITPPAHEYFDPDAAVQSVVASPAVPVTSPLTQFMIFRLNVETSATDR